MNIIDPNINPISSQFTNKAMKVAQTQVATVKTHKETSGKSKGDRELVTDNDMVHLSDKGLEAAKQGQQASHSGTMSEAAKKEKKKDVDERRVSVEDELKEKGGTSSGAVAKEEKTDELDPVTKMKVDEISKRKSEEIMDRDPKVPEGFATASKKIVEGQMKQGVPTEALTNLKDVPDPELALPSLKPAPNVDIAPIHDTNNKPMPMPMDSDTAIEILATDPVSRAAGSQTQVQKQMEAQGVADKSAVRKLEGSSQSHMK